MEIGVKVAISGIILLLGNVYKPLCHCRTDFSTLPHLQKNKTWDVFIEYTRVFRDEPNSVRSANIMLNYVNLELKNYSLMCNFNF